MTGLWLPLAGVAAALLASGALGYGLARALVPPAGGRAERAGWGCAVGLALLAASVPMGFAIHVPPAGMIGLVAALSAVAAWFLRRRADDRLASSPSRSEDRGRTGVRLWRLFQLLAVFGVAVYLLRALTEPMWSNDFLAIWGLKGKILFAAAGVPRRLFTDPALGFSHPEYPLGLPFLYAALSFLLGRWDDHAMALLFPFLQAVTLLALFGWLRRRGASRTLAFGASALLAQFEPLYSAFATGMADIPFSFVALLFGSALVDVLDRTDPFAVRRLALASFLAVSTKNEGLLLVAVGALLALVAPRAVRSASRSALAALLAPAIVLVGIGRLWKGSLPLRDFELGYLGPPLIFELLPRVGEAIRTAVSEVILPAWPGLLSVAALIAAGRRAPHSDRLLALALICAGAYLVLPSLAVLGPAWLVRTTLARTVSALAPLVAAAVAGRLALRRTTEDGNRETSA